MRNSFFLLSAIIVLLGSISLDSYVHNVSGQFYRLIDKIMVKTCFIDVEDKINPNRKSYETNKKLILNQ